MHRCHSGLPRAGHGGPGAGRRDRDPRSVPPRTDTERDRMIDATLIIKTERGERRVDLGAYLDSAAEEAAHQLAYTWIKQLRHVIVDGRTFRERFTVRGDSLWWFSEIYLHKEGAIV